ncbi:MAG: PqqD family protein [Gemmatimonadaceae bacterium]
MAEEFRRSDAFVYRLTAGEHLLVSLHGRRAETLFGLTATGAALWKELIDWRSVDALALRLTTDYDVTPEQARVDALEFLEQLTSLGAVERRGE